MTWTKRIEIAGIVWYTVAIILFIFDIITGNFGSSVASIIFFNFLGAGAFLTESILEKQKVGIWFNSLIFFIQFVCLYGIIFS